MNAEERIRWEIAQWENTMTKQPGLLERTSKTFSTKINNMLPQKVHDVVTSTVRAIIRTTLFGVELTPKRGISALPLVEADAEAREVLSLYQKIAVAEGAGTGAGGIMLSAVDFPALIAIKMKFLFEICHVYGFDTKQFSERIFILHLFQLTFSSPEQRVRLLRIIKQWEMEKEKWDSDSEFYAKMDWENFQKEYRDSIDFRKLLQMIPGIGAVVGAWANYSILEELGETAMNAYRMRRLSSMPR